MDVRRKFCQEKKPGAKFISANKFVAILSVVIIVGLFFDDLGKILVLGFYVNYDMPLDANWQLMPLVMMVSPMAPYHSN